MVKRGWVGGWVIGEQLIETWTPSGDGHVPDHWESQANYKASGSVQEQ